MSNLVNLFFATASKYPDHLAIVSKSENVTYEELASQVMATAAHLQNKGIKKGTHVLVFIPMSIKLYQTVLALFSMGAVVVFVDEWSDLRRLSKALEVVEVDVIIAPLKFLWLAYLLTPFRQIKSKISIPSNLASQTYKTADVDPQDTALITFTTGSTGLPKAADRTHQFLSEQFRILKQEIGAKPYDNCLVTLPIVLLSILGTGGTGIIADFNQKKPEKINAEQQVELISQQKVSIIISSPYYIEKIAAIKVSNPSVRKILTGGAPVFPDLAQEIITVFKDVQCDVAYGSTEAEPISIVAMKDITVDSSGLHVGKLHPEVKCKIVTITKDPITLGEKGWSEWETEFGEIVVSGPHVLDRYYNSEEAFRLNKIVDGKSIWHRTGDGGRFIGQNLYLTGRVSQLIRKEDSYLSMFTIEYQLRQIEGVALGTLIQKILVLELQFDANKVTVLKSLRKLNIPYEKIKIVPKIPRDPRHFSKIEYKKLEDLLKDRARFGQ